MVKMKVTILLVITLLLGLNMVCDAESLSERELYNLILEADKLKDEIQITQRSMKLIGYTYDGIEVQETLGSFSNVGDVMEVLGSHFTKRGARKEIIMLGLYAVGDRIGDICATGDPAYWVTEDSTYELVINHDNIKVVNVYMYDIDCDGNYIGSTYRFYILIYRDNAWKIDDMAFLWEVSTSGGRHAIIRASTTLLPWESYSPENVYDGNYKTAWVEGAAGHGIGEWIEYTFTDPQYIKSISIANGYTKSLDTYQRNSRVKRIGIEVDDVYIGDYELEDGVMDLQPIHLDYSKALARVRFIIKEVYPGTKYTDTCISEITFN